MPTPKAPKAQAVAPKDQAIAFSRPIVVNVDNLEMLDLKLFAELPMLANDSQAAQARLPYLIDMLDRLVVGGLSHRPASQFWALVEEVGKQINAGGNPND